MEIVARKCEVDAYQNNVDVCRRKVRVCNDLSRVRGVDENVSVSVDFRVTDAVRIEGMISRPSKLTLKRRDAGNIREIDLVLAVRKINDCVMASRS